MSQKNTHSPDTNGLLPEVTIKDLTDEENLVKIEVCRNSFMYYYTQLIYTLCFKPTFFNKTNLLSSEKLTLESTLNLTKLTFYVS